MSKMSRRKFTAEFKSNKVCIEALKEQQTIEALAKKYDLHPTQINRWKKEFLTHSAAVFETEGSPSPADKDQLIQALYAQIGEQKVALDFLKKNCCKAAAGAPYAGRERTSGFKCGGAMRTAGVGVSRSALYYQPVQENEENLSILRLLDEQYLKTPFYGVERLLVFLLVAGYPINRKRLCRLMQLQGWQTLYPAPRTTRMDPAAYKYPYLLRDLSIERKTRSGP